MSYGNRTLPDSRESGDEANQHSTHSWHGAKRRDHHHLKITAMMVVFVALISCHVRRVESVNSKINYSVHLV